MKPYLNWSACEVCWNSANECSCEDSCCANGWFSTECPTIKALEDLTGQRAMTKSEIKEWMKGKIIDLTK